MNKLIFTLNATWITAILLSIFAVQGMENYEQLALQATQYNENNCLSIAALNNDVLSHCLVPNANEVTSLKNSIKAFMKLSATCKKFNILLSAEKIGHLCKNFAQTDKNKALQNLIICLIHLRDAMYFPIIRLPALILIYSGVDVNTKDSDVYGACLLVYTVLLDDMPLAIELFNHHANPNIKLHNDSFISLRSRIKSVAMAKLFVNNGVDLDSTDKHENYISKSANVLWDMMSSEYPLDLLEFYLKQGVDARKLNIQESYHRIQNNCLLHYIADYPSNYGKQGAHCTAEESDLFLKKTKLILATIPDMINKTNSQVKNKMKNNWPFPQTPMDVAQDSLKNSHSPTYSALIEKIIILFEEYGGVTAQELAQQQELVQLAESNK